MPSSAALLSAYTTFAASAMLIRTVIAELQTVSIQLLPRGLHDKIMSKIKILIGDIWSKMCIIINERDGFSKNEVFEAAEIYLRTRISPSNNYLNVSKAHKEKDLIVTIHKGEEITDNFEGISLQWRLICKETRKTNHDDGYSSSRKVQKRSFQLRFDKRFKDKVLSSYLPFVLERSKAMKEDSKVLKLHALNFQDEYLLSELWQSVNLDHPSTFETLAMDPQLKQELIEDLNRFVRRRHFYKRVGKAWKRGYLLYGPPGTGKSSLVAAMANYLKFNIYDLELASVHKNSDLKKLLIATNNRSILVIEDIDCSIDLENREDGKDSLDPTLKKHRRLSNSKDQADGRDHRKEITLSGLLNFIDGLWSSCGDERIIVFTTNQKDRLDPALLRPGRMDMHIHMSYCTFGGFKILAFNYLGIRSHHKFNEIETLIANVEVTPAEIAEELMKSEHVETALEKVFMFLSNKRDECVRKKEGEKKAIGKKRKARK